MSKNLLLQNDFQWLDYIRWSGARGRGWVERYQASSAPKKDIDQAMHLLRAQRLDQGAELLRRAARGIEDITETSLSIGKALDRWYHGALAYLHYALDDFDAAHRSLDDARDAIASAIAHRAELLPLGPHCFDLRLQKARVARRQRRWPEMRGHLEVLLGMFQGEQPYCTLDDGRAIDLGSLREYLRPIPESREDAFVCRTLLGPRENQRRFFIGFAAPLYNLPGFVIPYTS